MGHLFVSISKRAKKLVFWLRVAWHGMAVCGGCLLHLSSSTTTKSNVICVSLVSSVSLLVLWVFLHFLQNHSLHSFMIIIVCGMAWFLVMLFFGVLNILLVSLVLLVLCGLVFGDLWEKTNKMMGWHGMAVYIVPSKVKNHPEHTSFSSCSSQSFPFLAKYPPSFSFLRLSFFCLTCYVIYRLNGNMWGKF